MYFGPSIHSFILRHKAFATFMNTIQEYQWQRAADHSASGWLTFYHFPRSLIQNISYSPVLKLLFLLKGLRETYLDSLVIFFNQNRIFNLNYLETTYSSNTVFDKQVKKRISVHGKGIQNWIEPLASTEMGMPLSFHIFRKLLPDRGSLISGVESQEIQTVSWEIK